MVLFRAFKKIAYPKKRVRFPRFRNPVQFILSDRDKIRRHTKRIKRQMSHLPLRRYEATDAFTNVTTTPQAFSMTYIAQGTNPDGQRASHKIFMHHVTYNGLLNWDSAGTPANAIRLILCSVKPDFVASTSGITTQSNIYDKQDFPDIGHVYLDRTIVRRDTTTNATKVRFFRRINKFINYDSDTVDDVRESGYNRIVCVVVGDLASTTDFTNASCIARYRG